MHSVTPVTGGRLLPLALGLVALNVVSLGLAAPPAEAQIVSLRGQVPSRAASAPDGGVTAATGFTVNFPATPVGETVSDPCASECFTDNNGSAGNCDGSGTISVEKALSAPFSVGNYRTTTSATSCTGTAVTLPVTLSAGQRLVFDFAFAPTSAGTFSDTLNLGGLIWTLNGSTSSTSGCTAGNQMLCLDSTRFAVTADWQTSDGTSGNANMVTLTDDTGYMWFFSSANVEAVVKVIDGCGLNNHFWVFAGGLTNVRVNLHVTDTATGATKTYVNPQGAAFQPIQDTSAFTCP